MLAQVEVLRLRFRRIVTEAETQVRGLEQQISELVLRATLETQEMLPELRTLYREIEAWKTQRGPVSDALVLGEDLREVSLRLERTQGQVSRLGDLLELSESDRKDQQVLLSSLQEQLQEKDHLLAIQNQWLQAAEAQESSLQCEIQSLRETVAELEARNEAIHTERRRYQDSLQELERTQERVQTAHEEDVKNVQMGFLQDLARAKTRWEQEFAELFGKTQAKLKDTEGQLEEEAQARAQERASLEVAETAREQLVSEVEQLKAEIDTLTAQLAAKELRSPSNSSPLPNALSIPVPRSPSHHSISEPIATSDALQAVVKSLEEENQQLKQRSWSSTPRPQPFSRDSLPTLQVSEAETLLQTVTAEK